MSVKGETESVFVSTFGMRGYYTLSTSKPVSIYADLGWSYTLGDTDGKTSNRFLNAGEYFSVQGVKVARNTAITGIGLQIQTGSNSSINLGYQGQFGSGIRESTGTLQWKLKF